MKLLFVNSHLFKIYNNNIYSGGQLNNKMLSYKYLNEFDELVVASRGKRVYKKTDIKDLSVTTGEKIKYQKLTNLNNLFSLTNYFKLKKEIRQNLKTADALTVRLPGIYSMIAIKEARKLNKPYFIEVVGNVFKAYWYHGRIIGKIIAPISQYLMKREVKNAKYIIYVTENYLQTVYKPNKNAITTNVLDVDIRNINQKVVFERINKIKKYNSSTRYKIGLIGTYSAKYKGFDTAIEAIGKMKKQNIKIDLHILGSGNSDWLKQKAKKNNLENEVYLDGVLKSGQEVMKWLDDKDFYLHPSYTEGLPRSLVEAMSRGLPCIGSNVGGIPELLKPEYLHEAKDSETLKEILNKCIKDKEKLINMSKENFENSEKYLMEKMLKKRNKFMEQFVGKELC